MSLYTYDFEGYISKLIFSLMDQKSFMGWT